MALSLTASKVATLIGGLALIGVSSAYAAPITVTFTQNLPAQVDLTQGNTAVALVRDTSTSSQTVSNPSILSGFTPVTGGAAFTAENQNSVGTTYNSSAVPAYDSGTGVRTAGGTNASQLNNGFQLTLFNSASDQTLKIYTAAYDATAALTATAAGTTYTSSSNLTATNNGQATGSYTVFVPANSGDTTLQFIESADNGTYDNVEVFGASVTASAASAVPEPAAIGLLSAGILPMVIRRRRRA